MSSLDMIFVACRCISYLYKKTAFLSCSFSLKMQSYLTYASSKPVLSQTKFKSPHKNQSFPGWSGYNGICPAGADTTVYVRLERIQRYMSGFGLHIVGPEASASASAPAVTDLVYMRRFRLLFGTV